MKLAGGQFKTVKRNQIVNLQNLLPWECLEAESISQFKQGLRLIHGQQVHKQILQALSRDVSTYTSNMAIADAESVQSHAFVQYNFFYYLCWRQKTGLEGLTLETIFFYVLVRYFHMISKAGRDGSNVILSGRVVPIRSNDVHLLMFS